MYLYTTGTFSTLEFYVAGALAFERSKLVTQPANMTTYIIIGANQGLKVVVHVHIKAQGGAEKVEHIPMYISGWAEKVVVQVHHLHPLVWHPCI